MKTVKLNQDLLKKQNITEQEEHALLAIHCLLQKVLENPDVVGIGQSSEVVTGLEYALQKIWGFPLDSNFHRYQNYISGCTCPGLDNQEFYGTEYRWYDSGCPVHSAENDYNYPRFT